MGSKIIGIPIGGIEIDDMYALRLRIVKSIAKAIRGTYTE